jgi:uncharacterized repeat protein (TIGR04138 family)
MLCQRCIRREALVSVTTRIRGTTSREYLCAECAQHEAVLVEPEVEYLRKLKPSSEIIQDIVTKDARFATAAYEFVWEAMDYAMDMKGRADDHERASDGISATELLVVIRTIALLRFGRAAKRNLNAWGIQSCEDIGEIAFRLVETGPFGKLPADRREDFQGGYDFDEAFPTE